jgi:hypothetical protein
VQKSGDRVASIVNGGARFAASSVDTGWITEMPIEIWQHRLARCVA